MTDAELTGLAERIRQELDELQRVLARIQEGWERARRSNDDYYLDGVALNLHGFYGGFERIFTHIAETIDDDLPHGGRLAQGPVATNAERNPRHPPRCYFNENGGNFG